MPSHVLWADAHFPVDSSMCVTCVVTEGIGFPLFRAIAYWLRSLLGVLVAFSFMLPLVGRPPRGREEMFKAFLSPLPARACGVFSCMVLPGMILCLGDVVAAQICFRYFKRMLCMLQ